jgi:hypothetical protein
MVCVKGGYAYSDNSETLTFAGVPVAFPLNSSPQQWLDRRRRCRIHVRAELIGQGRVPLQFGHRRFLAPAALVPFETSTMRSTRQARRKLPLQLRKPGRCAKRRSTRSSFFEEWMERVGPTPERSTLRAETVRFLAYARRIKTSLGFV